jgi:O-succinylbenzoate synthase
MTHRFAHRRYRLPFRAPVRTAHNVWREREGVLVRLENVTTGAVGYGEAAPIPWFGTESVDEIDAACRELGALVNDERLGSVPAQLGCLRNALATAQREAARSGDSPDALAEAGALAGSGSTAKADRRADYLSIAALLPAGRPALEVIESKSDAGFRVFKWKVGVAAVDDELALLDDVCAKLPDGAKLRLDANGAWDRRQAERWLERCAERPVEFLEQPCFAPASAGAVQQRKMEDVLRGLATDYPTPIALDESVVNEGDVGRWLESGWPGVFVIKPLLLADPQRMIDRLAIAKAPAVFSSALETAVGARAALRLAFGWPGERRALGFGVWPLFDDRRFDGPAAAPFVRWEDVERLDPATVWNALATRSGTP